MNSSFRNQLSDKLEKMHMKAMSFYNSGNYDAALKVWQNIKNIDPGFKSIDRYIVVSTQKLKSSESAPRSSTFRMQRDLMAKNGAGPRKRVFHPGVIHSDEHTRLRHRHIALLVVIFAISMLYLSVRNNRTYMIVLNTQTHNLDCFQGSFFPYGWQKFMELEIGIEHDWVSYVENRDVIRKLERGVAVRSRDAFDEQIIELFITLGDEAARQMTERAQQSAIYYYNRVYDASYQDRVVNKIIDSFVNLARIKIQAEDYRLAERYLQNAGRFKKQTPELLMVQKELENARNTGQRYF